MTARILEWGLLLFSTASLLTNAYYLQFLEPSVSRKTLAIGLFGVTGLVMFLRRYRLPGTGAEVSNLWVRARSFGNPRDRGKHHYRC